MQTNRLSAGATPEYLTCHKIPHAVPCQLITKRIAPQDLPTAMHSLILPCLFRIGPCIWNSRSEKVSCGRIVALRLSQPHITFFSRLSF